MFLEVIVRPAKDPGIKAHRVEYGTIKDDAFGTVLASKSILMPNTVVQFANMNYGAYAVRAFALLAASEKEYPTAFVASLPNRESQVLALEIT